MKPLQAELTTHRCLGQKIMVEKYKRTSETQKQILRIISLGKKDFQKHPRIVENLGHVHVQGKMHAKK